MNASSAKRGTRVRNVTTGETGTVLDGMQDGRLRVSVDIDQDEWDRSVIGSPSRITAVWERWNTSTDLEGAQP